MKKRRVNLQVMTKIVININEFNLILNNHDRTVMKTNSAHRKLIPNLTEQSIPNSTE